MDRQHEFYPLSIREVRPETSEAVTLVFDVPQALRETFSYKAGQYLTLRVSINGKEERRAYSMSSSPLESDLAITVKRVKNGVVSTYLNQVIKPGQVLDVMPPEGRFTPVLRPEQRAGYYLFAAGSGITPLLSILKTILEEEPKSTVYLLYGNRNEQSILFREVLADLEARYEGQLHVLHTLSQPEREKPKGLAGLFSKGQSSWEGKTGRINERLILDFLGTYPDKADTAQYLVCGPGNLIETVTDVLQKNGVPKSRVLAEYFANDGTDKKPASTAVQAAQVKVHLKGQAHDLYVPMGKTILDILIENRLNPPYSCCSGACSTCMAKVVSGKVQMDVCHALDDDEVESGYILTCQARPASPEVEIAYP